MYFPTVFEIASVWEGVAAEEVLLVLEEDSKLVVEELMRLDEEEPWVLDATPVEEGTLVDEDTIELWLEEIDEELPETPAVPFLM